MKRWQEANRRFCLAAERWRSVWIFIGTTCPPADSNSSFKAWDPRRSGSPWTASWRRCPSPAAFHLSRWNKWVITAANRLILTSSWNVWEFLILWREEECVILGPVWLFINLPFPFFWESVIFSSRPHWLRTTVTQRENKAFFIVTQFKNQLLFWGNLTGNFRGWCFSNKGCGNIMKSLCYACWSFVPL